MSLDDLVTGSIPVGGSLLLLSDTKKTSKKPLWLGKSRQTRQIMCRGAVYGLASAVVTHFISSMKMKGEARGQKGENGLLT